VSISLERWKDFDQNPSILKKRVIDDHFLKRHNPFHMSANGNEQEFQISLSAKGLEYLPMNCYENDFTVIVGQKKYDCPSFIADFLSPRLSDFDQ
jgi:hypothetical protein